MENYRILGEADCFKTPEDWAQWGDPNRETCWVCEKTIKKNAKISYDVHAGIFAELLPVPIEKDGATLYSNFDDEYNDYFGEGKGLLNKEGKIVAFDYNEMGWWPVGSECRKKIPAEFVSEFKRTSEADFIAALNSEPEGGN